MRVVSPAANTKFVILRERIKKKRRTIFITMPMLIQVSKVFLHEYIAVWPKIKTELGLYIYLTTICIPFSFLLSLLLIHASMWSCFVNRENNYCKKFVIETDWKNPALNSLPLIRRFLWMQNWKYFFYGVENNFNLVF